MCFSAIIPMLIILGLICRGNGMPMGGKRGGMCNRTRNDDIQIILAGGNTNCIECMERNRRIVINATLICSCTNSESNGRIAAERLIGECCGSRRCDLNQDVICEDKRMACLSFSYKCVDAGGPMNRDNLESLCFKIDDTSSSTVKQTSTNIATTSLTTKAITETISSSQSTFASSSSNTATQPTYQFGASITMRYFDGTDAPTTNTNQEVYAIPSNSWIAAVVVVVVLLLISGATAAVMCQKRRYRNCCCCRQKMEQSYPIVYVQEQTQNQAKVKTTATAYEEIATTSIDKCAFDNILYESNENASTSNYDHLCFTTNAENRKLHDSEYSTLHNEKDNEDKEKVIRINELYIPADLGDAEKNPNK